tara:strand:+ start:145 stop:513 length:369 start_codon:yes stop_codon:yes gene_type:complete
MIIIKKGHRKYPVINTPITKLYLIELQQKYPHGFYINNGKNLKFYKENVDYKRYDIQIDFINSLKIGSAILSFVYLVMLKKRVTKKVTSFGSNREELLEQIRESLKKKGQINDDPFGDGEEE